MSAGRPVFAVFMSGHGLILPARQSTLPGSDQSSYTKFLTGPLADVTKRLDAERHDHEGPRQHLATALRLLADCATMYERTDELGKRLANQAFYQRILITEDEKSGHPAQRAVRRPRTYINRCQVF